MNVRNIRTSLAPEVVTADIPELSSLAERLVDESLAAAVEMSGLGPREMKPDRLFRQPGFPKRFADALARSIARFLGASSDTVRSVYSFEPGADPESEMAGEWEGDLSVFLIAQVERRSSSLDVVVTSLDRAVTECLKEIGVPALAGRTTTLDVTLITQEEAASRTGVASLLSSLHTPALKIWER